MDEWNGVFRRSEDLQEEEVWALMKAREGSNPSSKTRKNSSVPSSPSASGWRFTAPRRSTPRSNSAGGGGVHQSSAPVNIPDWSKILRRKSSKNLWDDEYDHNNDDDGEDHGVRRSRHVKAVGNAESDDDDDVNGDDMVPPHEYLARRLASTQIASFSMCEGVGRTLKGRDLSKLRNAILTKTGFLE